MLTKKIVTALATGTILLGALTPFAFADTLTTPVASLTNTATSLTQSVVPTVTTVTQGVLPTVTGLLGSLNVGVSDTVGAGLTGGTAAVTNTANVAALGTSVQSSTAQTLQLGL